MDYLTEGAEFICNHGGKISCKDSGNRKVTYSGKTLLTTNAKKFSASGNCAYMTLQLKSTQFCTIHCNLSAWLSGFSPLKTSSNTALLNDKASCKCFASPFSFVKVNKSGVNGHITAGSVPASVSVAAAKILDAKISDDKKTASVKQNKNFSAQKVSENKQAAVFKISTEENVSVAKLKNAENVSAAKKIADVKFRCGDCKNTKCLYQKKSFREDSPIKNSSKDLKDNYYGYLSMLTGEKIADKIESRDKNLDFFKSLYRKISGATCTDADKFYAQSLIKLHEILEDTGKLAWWYAAHHIIPGNEVFKECPNCFRVANFIGENKLRVFDINESVNCIMLLRSNVSAKYDTIFDTLKKKIHSSKILPQFIRSFTDVDNYELMDLAESQLENKIQWHDTRHSYTFCDGTEKESFSKKFYGKILISYEKAVRNELENRVENRIDLKNVCPMAVRTAIINLIEEIRRHLSDFAKNPCASYPYYVTKKNYLYALLN